jgi:hypothetical protein
MFDSFSGSGGDSWKRIAGIPPMYYSTHSMSMMFLSIGEYPTEVSCFGFEDTIGDGIYGAGNNNWDNPFSNESALFKMSGGGVCRINEFRRCGTCKPSSYITSLVGTHANYQCAVMHHTFTTGPVFGQEGSVEYVSNLINSKKYVSEKNNINQWRRVVFWDYLCNRVHWFMLFKWTECREKYGSNKLIKSSRGFESLSAHNKIFKYETKICNRMYL